jgi:predicted ATPase
MEFTPLTVIAGVNASGKSNLFDALQLLASLAETDLKTAFRQQRGDPKELFTQYGEDEYVSEMEFTVEMLVNPTVQDNRGEEANLEYTRLEYQLKIKRVINEKNVEDLLIDNEALKSLHPTQDDWVKKHIPENIVEDWRTKIEQDSVLFTDFPELYKKTYIFTKKYFGTTQIVVREYDPDAPKTDEVEDSFFGNTLLQTALSRIDSIDYYHSFAAKKEMQSWKLLQLNPEDLRQPTRKDTFYEDQITSSGKNLAAALYRIKQDDEYKLIEISRTVNNILPNVTEVNVYDDKANRQFIIKITGDDGIEFSSRVLSEGTLRLLALCVLLYDNKHTGLLCFEEPENGVHPCRIKDIAKLLKDLTVDFENPETPLRQVIVNTHSSVLVGELIEWQKDKNVSIWLSQLNSLITDIEGKRTKLRITKILPVAKEKEINQTLSFSEQERKLTLTKVIEYLETADPKNAIDEIKAIR